MKARPGKPVMRRLGCLFVAVAVLAAIVGCSGRTIGASQITEQPDGLYSAKLNAIGTCEKGSKRTPCTAYVRWREVGTDAWTNGPPIEVDAKVTDRRGSQPVMGLDPNAEYEYQACGKEFRSDRVMCVGPDGSSDTTQRFVVDANAGVQGETEAPASEPASEASDETGDSLGGASLLVPALIALGVMALLFGGMLWVTRGPAQSPPRPGSPTAATAPAPDADAGPPMEREPKAAGKNDAPARRSRSERPPGERARKQSTAKKERTLRNYERAVAQLEVVEADAAEAEARASRAERLLTLQAEEVEGARRLREILEQIGEAERRMSEATAREQESLERAKE
jgi:hypothetical protein